MHWSGSQAAIFEGAIGSLPAIGRSAVGLQAVSWSNERRFSRLPGGLAQSPQPMPRWMTVMTAAQHCTAMHRRLRKTCWLPPILATAGVWLSCTSTNNSAMPGETSNALPSSTEASVLQSSSSAHSETEAIQTVAVSENNSATSAHTMASVSNPFVTSQANETGVATSTLQATSVEPTTSAATAFTSGVQETSTRSESSTLPPEPEIDAHTMATEMGVGTNIGNTLENTTEWETGWGQPLVTREFVNGLASRGLKTVRVPVAWDTYASNGQIDQAKLERVKEVVSWINDAELFAIVNIHWDGGWIFSEGKESAFQLTDDVRTKFESYWTQIASAFSTVGHKLVFEGMNEEGRFFLGGDEGAHPTTLR